MTTVLAQELAPRHGIWLRPAAIESTLSSCGSLVGTVFPAGSLPGSLAAESLGIVAETCRLPRPSGHLPSAAGNTGWTSEQCRTLVVYWPRWECSSLLGQPGDLPVLLAYDPLSGSRDAELHSVHSVQAVRSKPPQVLLTELGNWTDLPISRMGELLGVARRSLYNWMEGRPASNDLQRRLDRVHAIIEQVIGAHGTASAWLDTGHPTNFELLSQQQWALVEQRLKGSQPVPAIPLDDTAEPTVEDEPEVLAAVRNAVLAAFVAPLPRADTAQASEWVPRELTGAIPFDEDTDEEL